MKLVGVQVSAGASQWLSVSAGSGCQFVPVSGCQFVLVSGCR